MDAVNVEGFGSPELCPPPGPVPGDADCLPDPVAGEIHQVNQGLVIVPECVGSQAVLATLSVRSTVVHVLVGNTEKPRKSSHQTGAELSGKIRPEPEVSALSMGVLS